MAGDWIKIEKSTARKPEVLAISSALGIHPDHAFGMCVRFWAWCDDQIENGHAQSVTNVTLDLVIGHNGFAQQLIRVGWLIESETGIDVPNFDYHLSESAKTRANAAKRKSKSRAKRDKCHGEIVTKVGPENRREEKRESIYIASEVLIPKEMQSEKVQEYFRTWMAHLALEYPEKVPPENSPQLEMFWMDAARMGPERFCDSVQYSTANNWATLHERKESTKSKPAAASYPEDLLLICSTSQQYRDDIPKRKEILGPRLFSIAKRLGITNILEAIGNDWKMKSLVQFYNQYASEVEAA